MSETSGPTAWNKIDWNALNDEEFAQAMLKRLAAEPARFSEMGLETIEKRAQADGVIRRAALVFLAKPGKWMLETIAQDRAFAVAAADLQECIHDYLKRHDAMRELLEAVDARLMVALAQREDMAEVIREAKARNP